jgi:hypothetical protein
MANHAGVETKRLPENEKHHETCGLDTPLQEPSGYSTSGVGLGFESVRWLVILQFFTYQICYNYYMTKDADDKADFTFLLKQKPMLTRSAQI